MKLKKLFAGIVAVAMMATMAAPAFANQIVVDSNKVQGNLNNGQVAIKKVITGTGYGSETIQLEVKNGGEAVGVYHSELTTEKAPTISIPATETNGVTISETNGGKGTLHIKLQEYKRVGTYVYEFAEKAGSTAGMTYDTTTKWLVVNAYNDFDDVGTLKADLLVNAVVLNDDPTRTLEAGSDLSGMDGNKIDQIDNEYNAGTYTVKKLVEGNMSDRAKKFNFLVTFKKAKDVTIPGILKKNEPLTLNWTDSEDNTQTATTPIQLSHNEDITFNNIPYGVTVSVVELDDNMGAVGNTNGEYTVEYTDDANGVKLGSDETKGEKPSGAATITNKSTVNVNTGVILDNAPYIALLTIVAAGAVVMIMKKRRNYED